jgi:hypothetical protein
MAAMDDRRSARREDRAPPGVGLRHPIALFGLALLLVNDHWLKARFPGVITGKLSDVGGLLFFPQFLHALWEIGAPGRVRDRVRSHDALVGAAIATGIVFALVKVWGPANDAYRYGLAALQWPFRAIFSGIAGHGAPGLAPVSLQRDATDLVALPALVVAVWAGRSRLRGARSRRS